MLINKINIVYLMIDGMKTISVLITMREKAKKLMLIISQTIWV